MGVSEARKPRALDGSATVYDDKAELEQLSVELKQLIHKQLPVELNQYNQKQSEYNLGEVHDSVRYAPLCVWSIQ